MQGWKTCVSHVAGVGHAGVEGHVAGVGHAGWRTCVCRVAWVGHAEVEGMCESCGRGKSCRGGGQEEEGHK